MKQTPLICMLCLVIAVLAPGVARAGTYYVSPTGVALWTSCTSTNAPCSWQTAMASAAAGDLVYFRGGTYDVGVIGPNRDYANMSPAHSGTAGNPITFKAYPGETPTITGTVNNTSTNTSEAGYFGCTHADYVTWDGFAATMQLYTYYTETQIFSAWTSSYCTIRNSNFTGLNVGTWGYNTSLVRVEHSNYALIENNYFHDLTGTSTAVNTTAIWLFDSLYTTVRNNTIANSVGGVYAKTTASNASIYYNFIYNASNACFQGVNLNCETADACTGHMVYQNVIVGCDSGFYFRTDYAASGIKAYNNVLYGPNASDAIDIDLPNSGVEVFNNVVVAKSSLERFDPAAIAYANNNIFYSTGSSEWNNGWTTTYTSVSAWTTATGFDANSFVENPRFTKPGSSKPGDYKINANHKNSGRGGGTYSSVIGAYITGTERIGYLPAPKNLH